MELVVLEQLFVLLATILSFSITQSVILILRALQVIFQILGITLANLVSILVWNASNHQENVHHVPKVRYLMALVFLCVPMAITVMK